MNLSGYFVVAFGLVVALPAGAQKRWADAREYELNQQVSVEKDPVRQIEVLSEWQTAYPKSDFQWERGAWFVLAYKAASRPADAFASAAGLVRLEPTNVGGLLMIAELAPLLSTPTPDQVKITRLAASTLLTRATEIGRAATAIQERELHRKDTPSEVSDAEAEHVLALIREWRDGKSIRTASDVEREVKRIADRALEWAKGFPE